MATPKEQRKQVNWHFSKSRKNNLEIARQTLAVLVAIGKKYRNREKGKFRAIGLPR